MNESIYNLVPYERSEVVKKPMYKSTHNMKASVPNSTFGMLEPLQLATFIILVLMF